MDKDTLQAQMDAYRNYFLRPYEPVYKKAILKATAKPLSERKNPEEPGCIFNDLQYEFNDYYIKVRRNEILDVIKNLKVYKSKRGGWGVLPVASLLSGNTEPARREKELSLADSFITLLDYADLGDADLRSAVNSLDFFVLYHPMPGKQLLERPSDLSQFIVIPDQEWM